MSKLFSLIAAATVVGSSAQETRMPVGLRPRPVPPPVFRPSIQRADEKPVSVDTTTEVVEDNGLYRRVRTVFTFTNPNARDFSGELEFPIPDGATVCGYALEIDGLMVPGVVAEKEKARVAFESEKAKRVDPGIVEHVAGNVWKTRIFPLRHDTPRKAQVDYIAPVADGGDLVVCERDGGDVFVGRRAGSAEAVQTVAAKIAGFAKGVILWDASGSAESCAAEWRKRLDALPDKGEWRLVIFRNDTTEQTFADKGALLSAIDALDYDGGTDIGAAVAAAGYGPVLLFTDEVDTIGLDASDYESRANVVIASRGDPAPRVVTVRKLADGEKTPNGVEAKEGTLLATAWAADRISDLSSQAEDRKAEFLALGRRYGVASPVTSLIVLESLDQYITHKIEPPKEMPFHDEWVKRMAAKDDEISRKEADAEHERDLLALWKERVEWWNNPIPPKSTPKSGFFDNIAAAFRGDRRSEEVQDGMPAASAVAPESIESSLAAGAPARVNRSGVARSEPMRPQMGGMARKTKSAVLDSSQAGGGGATITVAAWDPKAPYLDAIGKAKDAYAEYLAQKKSNGSAPAFYMDCSSWFFKKGDLAAGWRILSNMAEFKLEDAAIWRSMGWRLREAGCREDAIRCFRKVLRLRGEEGQSRRDLALVLAEQGKALAEKDAAGAAALIGEAMALLKDAAFTNWARRSGRRSNDRQVSIVSLEELNALISWCEAVGVKAPVPEIDPAYRRDLPVKIRIVLSWDADETDIDLHVLEPDGEEAYYRHRRTSTGGFVSEDVTTGYGPEEYLRKEGRGKFKVLTNYFASHQTSLTGATTVTATVYTDWGTAAERMKILTLRLDKPKDRHFVGEVSVE